MGESAPPEATPRPAADQPQPDPPVQGQVGTQAVAPIVGGPSLTPGGHAPSDVRFMIFGQVGAPRAYLSPDFRYRSPDIGDPGFWAHANWLGEPTVQLGLGWDYTGSQHVLAQATLNVVKLHFPHALMPIAVPGESGEPGDLDIGVQTGVQADISASGASLAQQTGVFAQGTFADHWVAQFMVTASVGLAGSPTGQLQNVTATASFGYQFP